MEADVTAPVRQFAANPSSPVDTVKCLVEIPKGSRNKYDYEDLDPNRRSSVKGWRDREAAWGEIESVAAAT